VRFYGLTPDEVWALPAEDEEMLWQAITVVEAQETLVQLQVASYAHMKPDDQRKLHRKLHEMAFPTVYEKPVALTPEQMAKLLHG
jgi:hypothetical protein